MDDEIAKDNIAMEGVRSRAAGENHAKQDEPRRPVASTASPATDAVNNGVATASTNDALTKDSNRKKESDTGSSGFAAATKKDKENIKIKNITVGGTIPSLLLDFYLGSYITYTSIGQRR
jgi:hypothetical protein